MATTSSTSSSSSATSGLSTYLSMARQAGTGLKTAEKDMLAALKTGDETKIQEAKMKYDAAARVFELISAMMKKMDDILSGIINRIGR